MTVFLAGLGAKPAFFPNSINGPVYKVDWDDLRGLVEVDLRPQVVDNHTMGQVFEELLRRFSEMSNETSGEHYTPRDQAGKLTWGLHRSLKR